MTTLQLHVPVAGTVDDSGTVRWSLTRVAEVARLSWNRQMQGMWVLTPEGEAAYREERQCRSKSGT